MLGNSKKVNYITDGEIDLSLIDTIHLNDKRKTPAYKYKISIHGTKKNVGNIEIIIGYNKTVRYCGNIGCTINKPYRGNNFALKACKLIKQVAILNEMNKIYITCSPSNFASLRICEKLGCNYLETIDLPLNKKLCIIGEGQKKVCVFEYLLTTEHV